MSSFEDIEGDEYDSPDVLDDDDEGEVDDGLTEEERERLEAEATREAKQINIGVRASQNDDEDPDEDEDFEEYGDEDDEYINDDDDDDGEADEEDDDDGEADEADEAEADEEDDGDGDGEADEADDDEGTPFPTARASSRSRPRDTDDIPTRGTSKLPATKPSRSLVTTRPVSSSKPQEPIITPTIPRPTTTTKAPRPAKVATGKKAKRAPIVVNLPPEPQINDLVRLEVGESVSMLEGRRRLAQAIFNKKELGMNRIAAVQLASCLMNKVRYGIKYDDEFEQVINLVLKSLQ